MTVFKAANKVVKLKQYNNFFKKNTLKAFIKKKELAEGNFKQDKQTSLLKTQ